MEPILARAVVSFEFDPDGASGVFTEVDGNTSIGATGTVGASKDKTTLSSTVKEYGAAMSDTPDKDIKFQYYATDANQRQLVLAARAKKQINMKTVWDDGTEAVVNLALLGFEADEGTSEDWRMATVKAKQSGAVIWTDPVVGS